LNFCTKKKVFSKSRKSNSTKSTIEEKMSSPASPAIPNEKANAFMYEAEKKLKGFVLPSWLGGSSGKEEKFSDAAELFKKAGDQYKLTKTWEYSANAYTKAAECSIKSGSKYDAAMYYVNAANAFKSVNLQEAINCFKIAIELCTDEGKFSMAGKHQKDLGELYEQEAGENSYFNAMESYKTAADLYESEGSNSTATGCLLKAADCGVMSGKPELVEKSGEIYEKIARSSVDNNLLKFSVKGYLLMAGLCRLYKGDTVAVRRALDDYQNWDATFCTTREFKLLEDILNAYEGYNPDAFQQAITEYDSISKFDKKQTPLLVQIKNAIKNAQNNSMA